jgi:hypothetical protein
VSFQRKTDRSSLALASVLTSGLNARQLTDLALSLERVDLAPFRERPELDAIALVSRREQFAVPAERDRVEAWTSRAAGAPTNAIPI